MQWIRPNWQWFDDRAGVRRRAWDQGWCIGSPSNAMRERSVDACQERRQRSWLGILEMALQAVRPFGRRSPQGIVEGRFDAIEKCRSSALQWRTGRIRYASMRTSANLTHSADPRRGHKNQSVASPQSSEVFGLPRGPKGPSAYLETRVGLKLMRIGRFERSRAYVQWSVPKRQEEEHRLPQLWKARARESWLLLGTRRWQSDDAWERR